MFLQIFHPTLLVARVCQADCCDRAKSCKLIWKMPLYRVQIFGTVTRRPVSLPVPWNFYLEQMGISKRRCVSESSSITCGPSPSWRLSE
ncbi:hypothetical protein F5051DRAFT_413621 [Lentinula edodes]|nr:hypothetical protein F5051DRAFT_413621 [Lentinula edodes]